MYSSKEARSRELEKREMVYMIPHIIGISGVTGAGKSTLTKVLAQALNATVVSWDEFDDVSTEPSDYIEWYHRGRHYDEFRREALENVLKILKINKIAIHPVSQQTLVPTKYIIFDAPLGKLHEQTGKYIGTCVHLHVPLDLSLCRRILRDFTDPVKTKETLLEELSFYCDYSRPLFFDDDLRRTADLVVDGVLSSEKQLEVVKNYLIGEQGMQKELDSYRNLCTEVYDLSKPTPSKDAYDFYRDYVIKAQGLILEPMCGTGRFLLPFLEEGFDVRGFDASEHMLSALQAKALAKKLEPKVWKGFVEDLKPDGKYNLIYIPSGSFCLITDRSAVNLVLKRLYESLSEDGTLVFEVETLKAIPELNVWRGSAWHKSDGTMIILSQLAIPPEGNVSNSICKYELIRDQKIVDTEIEEIKVRIYDPAELTGIIKSCGFKRIRVIKAFNHTLAPDKEDETVVYECRK